MIDKSDRAQKQMTNRSRISVLSAVLGLVALASAALVGVISFTAFNPPDWIRFGAFVLFGLSFFGSILLGLLSLKSPRRAWAVVGLVLCALSTATCIGMLFLGG